MHCEADNPYNTWCWYEGTQLRAMLAAHEARGRGSDSSCGQRTCYYNEIPVNGSFWAAQLPQIVRGVFFPRGEANAESVARRVHTAFVQAFPDRAEATPLMSYDMSRLSAPFRLQNTPLW